MAKENIKVDYDKEEDIMSLFREGSSVKFSFDISLPNGEIVVDYDFNGHIVGIEFFNASSYFPFLKEINGSKIKADMKVQYGPNWAQIHYIFHVPGIKEPISNFINAPYNKKLILEN